MRRCPHDECGWQAISPSERGAREQLAEHLVDVHARTVDAEIPDGMVQVKAGDDGEWRTVTVEDAKILHRALHDGTDGPG